MADVSVISTGGSPGYTGIRARIGGDISYIFMMVHNYAGRPGWRDICREAPVAWNRSYQRSFEEEWGG
ncbi:MAG: hypothetical protein Kow0099_24190 [Candidatus Abyssubacteria bacterium]